MSTNSKIVVKKEKGNSELNKKRKEFLEYIKKKYGNIFAEWISAQEENILIEEEG